MPSDDAADTGGGSPMLALAVDTLRQGLLVFDASGHVLSANAAARRAIDARPDIELEASPEPPAGRIRLQIRKSATQLKLERSLRACAAMGMQPPTLRMSTARGARPAQALILTTRLGQPELILQLSPMPMHVSDGDRAVVLGVLIDRAYTPTLDPELLRDLFGLTEAESRVAEAYLRVDSVKDVAQLLGVSVNTVKTHLAASY
jgi:PAS domain-containing protein